MPLLSSHLPRMADKLVLLLLLGVSGGCFYMSPEEYTALTSKGAGADTATTGDEGEGDGADGSGDSGGADGADGADGTDGTDSGTPDDADGDGYSSPEDCDDEDASVYPGAVEHCDEVDEDCDTLTDEEPADGATWYLDDDGDGFGEIGSPTVACAAPEHYVATGDDCDDSRELVYPGSHETEEGNDRVWFPH